MSEAKWFTPVEAMKTLPLVRQIVQDILGLGQQIREVSAKFGTGAEDHPEVLKAMDELEEMFLELEQLGCSYKDWNFTVGLVDFPAVIGGQEVCLCWRSDEAEIKYYHDLESGFAGRKPIPQEYFSGSVR